MGNKNLCEFPAAPSGVSFAWVCGESNARDPAGSAIQRSGRPAEAEHAGHGLGFSSEGRLHTGMTIRLRPGPGRRRYLWITVVYNITYSVALNALVLFYLGTY